MKNPLLPHEQETRGCLPLVDCRVGSSGDTGGDEYDHNSFLMMQMQPHLNLNLLANFTGEKERKGIKFTEHIYLPSPYQLLPTLTKQSPTSPTNPIKSLSKQRTRSTIHQDPNREGKPTKKQIGLHTVLVRLPQQGTAKRNRRYGTGRAAVRYGRHAQGSILRIPRLQGRRAETLPLSYGYSQRKHYGIPQFLPRLVQNCGVMNV